MDDDYLHRSYRIPDAADLDAYRGLADVQPMLWKSDLVSHALRAIDAGPSRCPRQRVPVAGGHHQYPIDANFRRGPKSANCSFADVLLPDNVRFVIRMFSSDA